MACGPSRPCCGSHDARRSLGMSEHGQVCQCSQCVEPNLALNAWVYMAQTWNK
jgi:hypothetical protein